MVTFTFRAGFRVNRSVIFVLGRLVVEALLTTGVVCVTVVRFLSELIVPLFNFGASSQYGLTVVEMNLTGMPSNLFRVTLSAPARMVWLSNLSIEGFLFELANQ